MNFFKIICITSIILFLSGNIYAATPPSFKQNRIKVDAEMGLYQSDANYDSQGGNFTKLGNNKQLELYDLKFSTYHAASPIFTFYGSLGLTQAQSTNTDFNRTKLSATELLLGSHYKILRTPTHWVADFSAIIPFNRIDPNGDEVLTGEGSTQFTLANWIYGRLFGSIHSHLYFGYTYRDEGRSGLLPWQIGLTTKISKFSVGGELHGFESVSDDEFTNSPNNRTLITDKVNAGSLKFYSINPSLMAINVWSDFAFNKTFSLRIGYDKTINGKSYAEGSRIYLTLSSDFKLGPLPKKPPQPSLFGKKNSKEVEKFEADAEKYDEKLFDPKYRQKRQQQKKNNQKLLNETEQLLENK